MSKIWIQTYTGKAFDLLEPKADQVDPYDIAVSLADKPRYSAHTRRRITVGQHSILCAAAAYRMAIAEGLGEVEAVRRARLLALHDAAEAMIGDVLGPARMAIKHYVQMLVTKYIGADRVMATSGDTFDVFAALDRDVSRVIFESFRVPYDTMSSEDRALILRIDRSELLFEKTWFVQTREPRAWGVPGEPLQLDLFGAGASGPAALDQAVLVTQPWEVETTVAAYMLTLERLGLIDLSWSAKVDGGGGPLHLFAAYFTGFPRGFNVVRQLFGTPA